MCVRYTLHRPDAAVASVARALNRKIEPPPWAEPRYNVTLTHTVPVIAAPEGSPALAAMRWGFPGVGPSGLLPNAKAETARSLRSFKGAAEKRRCLVPANGFYEWQTRGGVKWPHLFTLADEEPLAFAGIWQPLGDDLPSGFCLLTTTPNTLVAPIHNRMPVLLRGDECTEWLSEGGLPESTWTRLTRSVPANALRVRPVSRFVSSTRNEGPACHAPVDTTGEQTELF